MKGPTHSHQTSLLSRRQWLLASTVAALGSATGCLKFSPFDTDLPEDESNITVKQLSALGQRHPGYNWKFAVVSDTHLGYGPLASTVAKLNGRSDIDLVLVPGDITDLGLREEYRNSLSILSDLNVPFLTAIGNHDAISNGKELYTSMFGPSDYVFDFGGLRFVVINTCAYEYDYPVPNIKWLESQLTAAGQLPVVVVCHVPPTSEQLDFLAGFPVVATIAGHWHQTVYCPSPVAMFAAPHGAVGDYAIVEVSGRNLSFTACEQGLCKRVDT